MIDGRLLVPAVAAWLGAALALAWSALAVVIGAVVLAGVCVLFGNRRQRSSRPSSRVGIAGMVVVFLVLGAGAAALSQWRLSPQPLEGWVSQRASAVVVGAIAGEPRVHRPASSGQWWAEGSVSVRVITRTVTARGEVLALQVPLTLRLPVHSALPPRGTVISVSGRLAPVDAASGMAAEVRSSNPDWAVLAEPGPLDRLVTAMRSALAASLGSASPDAAALVMGLTIGDDSTASQDLTDAMRASGLAHLVAVSGGNVAIVVGVVIAAATLLRWPLVARVLLGLVALVYYAFLVGPEPSVLRASVMGAVVLVGVLVGGRRGGPSVLAVGVLGLVLVQPSLALSWGFALSAVATGGLILLAPILRGWLLRWSLTSRLPGVMVQALALTLAAQLATLPVLIAMGGAAGWVSVPANMAAMPAVAPVTVLGLLATVLGPWLPALAQGASALAALPAGWIAKVAATAQRLPAADWPVGSWPSGWVGLAVTLLTVGSGFIVVRIARSAIWRRQPRMMQRIILGTAAAVVGLVALRPPDQQGWPPPDWLVLMCDVGQGDALLLRADDESAVVVDTGSDPDKVAACLDQAGITDVPAVVLTHFHADHVSGLAGIFRAASVGAVFSTPVHDPREQSDLVREIASEGGREVVTITAGDARRVGDVSWRALWPRRIIRAGSIPNNASIVLLASVGRRSILLTGDIEPAAQRALLADVTLASAQGIDIVKVPHHGSRHQSPDFARAAHAPIALVSVGLDNDYGHPAPETLELYGSGGALVLRTDLHGDVAVVDRDAALGVVPRRGMLQTP